MPTIGLPSSGGDVDGVVVGVQGDSGRVALPGWPFRVEAATALSSGAQIATDANGRARVAVAGEKVIARTLQSASGPTGADFHLVWCVFSSGR